MEIYNVIGNWIKKMYTYYCDDVYVHTQKGFGKKYSNMIFLA